MEPKDKYIYGAEALPLELRFWLQPYRDLNDAQRQEIDTKWGETGDLFLEDNVSHVKNVLVAHAMIDEWVTDGLFDGRPFALAVLRYIALPTPGDGSSATPEEISRHTAISLPDVHAAIEYLLDEGLIDIGGDEAREISQRNEDEYERTVYTSEMFYIYANDFCIATEIVDDAHAIFVESQINAE